MDRSYVGVKSGSSKFNREFILQGEEKVLYSNIKNSYTGLEATCKDGLVSLKFDGPATIGACVNVDGLNGVITSIDLEKKDITVDTNIRGKEFKKKKVNLSFLIDKAHMYYLEADGDLELKVDEKETDVKALNHGVETVTKASVTLCTGSFGKISIKNKSSEPVRYLATVWSE